jgi:superfamily II DNA or RNA helicase
MPDPAGEFGYVRVTPSGQLLPDPPAGDPAGLSPAVRGALEAFARSPAEGLFDLAATTASGGLPAPLGWWRDFAARYLTERCHTPAGTIDLDPVPPPEPGDLRDLLFAAPPMKGAEYLDAPVLQGLWTSLDDLVRREALMRGGLEALLAARAPLWRQVGRVCFHLAEDPRDAALPFRFLATYAPRLSAEAGLRYQPLARALVEMAGERNRPALVHLLGPVHRAAEQSPLMRGLVESGEVFEAPSWTPDQAYRFLRDVPVFEECGVLVRVPDWWTRRSRPRVGVRIGSVPHGKLNAEALLDFTVEAAVGGERVGRGELRRLLDGSDGLVLFKGNWVEVDRARLAEALERWEAVEREAGEGGITFAEGMRLLAGAPADLGDDEGPATDGWSFAEPGAWMKDLLARLRSPDALRSALPGRELHASLRPYQEVGVRWLKLLAGLGLGACLADDMGLGKTLQVLALLFLLRRESAGPSLLVMPSSLLANWAAEIERFAPSLRTLFVHPAFGRLDGTPRLAGVDAVITSYGMLERQPWLQEAAWTLVVLDEAQAIKNAGSRQARAAKRLTAKARIALTGTPVENRLSDLWSLFDFLNPGLLGPAKRFREFAREGYGPLRGLVRPYILRRLKTDRNIIADLPDKTVVTAWCGLTKIQAALYRKAVDDLADDLEGREGMERRGLVLASLMRLKQVCNHPAQLRGDGRWDSAESGKFARLAEIAGEIAGRQDRALVFTQFRELAEPLASFLAGIFGRPGLVLHGGTAVRERADRVAAFQREDGPPFFVLSLKAGGTGLNLTAASHVIHFDRWWNPAVENQATDRAFRIGQRRNVLVHTFVCRGTVEERIDAMIREKTALADGLLDASGEALLTEMKDEELMATVALDLERAGTR